MPQTVFDYIKHEENAYKTVHVPVADGYEFNMYEHVRMSTLFRDSKYTKGANDFSRPFRNIIRRIRNLALVAMDIDVKDIMPYVNDSKNYYKSFLLKKYYPQWARKYDIDTYIDDLIESYEDYGLALSKHVNKIAPEVVQLQSIAFCDQTDILSGPICLKHQYSPAHLKEFEGKWGSKDVGADVTIDELILLARNEKVDVSGTRNTKTPGKFIEVYELDGMFTDAWLNDEPASADDKKYSPQLHIVAFYQDEKGAKQGVHLFKGKGDPTKYKALVRDKIFGRACGMGGVEELFHPQIWTNYDEIRIQGMLDAAAKVVHVTTDPTFANKNDLKNIENNEILTAKENTTITQLNTQPVNLVAFENASNRWEEHAKGIGSAYDAQLGQSPSSGTPFKLQDAVITQGEGLHEKRKGKIATHLGEIHRDWVLDDLVREMNNEQEFSEELDLDELQYVADSIVTCQTNDFIKEKIFNGELVGPEEIDSYKQQVRDSFMKGGSKKFFSLLKNELKGLPVDVEIVIAGKQKNLSKMADTMSNIFRQIFSNPQGFVQTMQIPGASSSFNELLEASGVAPWRFNEMNDQQKQALMQPPQPSPLSTVTAGAPVLQ